MNLSFFCREAMRAKAGETPFDEMEATYNVIHEIKNQIEGQPNNVEYVYRIWLDKRLNRERDKYERKGIPKERWPKALQGIDTQETFCKTVSPQIKTDDPVPLQIDTPQTFQDEAALPEKKRVNDPFRSDGFGKVLGEPEELRGLGNKRRY